MVKKAIILLVLYFFLQIYLTSLRGIEYFAKEPERVGTGCFWPLGAGAGAARKKCQEAEPEPLEKKSQEPEPLKNLPAPQP